MYLNHRIIRAWLLIIEDIKLKLPWVCSRSCSDFESQESSRPRVVKIAAVFKGPERIGWLLIVFSRVHPSVSQLSAGPGSVRPISWSDSRPPPSSLWSHTPSLYLRQHTLRIMACSLPRRSYLVKISQYPQCSWCSRRDLACRSEVPPPLCPKASLQSIQPCIFSDDSFRGDRLQLTLTCKGLCFW